LFLRELGADTGSFFHPSGVLWRSCICFSHTATVESDFSIIGWEKDDYRADLTDFSLEGILHCMQFKTLKALSRDLYIYKEIRSG
jgi:hypothetical protein